MQLTSSAPSLLSLEQENRRLRALLRSAGIDPASDPADSGRGEAVGRPAPGHGSFELDQVLLDAMAEGVYAVDLDGRTTVCNAAMLRMLGFDQADEVIGTRLHPVIHHTRADGSPYAAEACPIHRAALEGVSAVVDDEHFFRRDGTGFPVEYRAEPLVRDGALMGAVCTFVDISARVEAEHQLKESRERLALALQGSGIGIWDYAARTAELRWDDRVRELFGLSAGKPITIEANLAAVHPDDRTRVGPALASAFDPRGLGAYEIQFRTIGIEDGLVRWVEAQGRATFENGEAVRLLGVLRDISRDKEAERHLRLMVNELNHRVKNSLAMVQGLAAQTFRSTVDLDAARVAFTERVVALARAHDVLTENNWEGADLRRVVEQAIALQAGDEAGRVDVAGPRVQLSPKGALAFSLSLHELATNATRHGALSVPGGRVAIAWTTQGEERDRRLRFTWIESGGPVVSVPQHRGFGLKLVERGLSSELQGIVRIEFPRDGIVHTIDAPLPSADLGHPMS